jgi:Ca-activated chloride channel family protein
LNDDRTQLVGGGGTVMGGATVAYDPDRTQFAPPPAPGAFVPSPVGAPAGPALTLSVRVGGRAAYSGERTRQHVMTQVTASGAAGAAGGGPRMPVNVALVIDRSGSMEGEPLEYVKRACSYVVDMLTPNDVLSIVTFEETVEVLMPARRVTDPNLIKQHIARITPGNTTNLFDGLYAGGAQVASVPPAGYVNRVLLLTDGEPTAGLKDFASIVAQVADMKARGVTVTALGFGPEYNEELMAGIARRSGGNYYHIERPEMIPDVFRREMEQVLGVTAKNIRLTFQLPRNAMVRQVYGTPPAFGPRTAEIALGDLEKGATVTKLWEMDWEPRPAGTYRVAKAVLTYENGTTGQTETQVANAVVEFTTDAGAIVAGQDPQVGQEVALAQASRDLERTMMGMRTQQFSAADLTQALDRTQMLLTQQGRTREAQEIAQAAQQARTMVMSPGGAPPAAGGGGGGTVNLEKTLIGAIYHLDQGKRSR